MTIGSSSWPTPEKFLDPGDIRTFGYTKSVLLAGRLEVPSTFTEQAVAIHAEVRWLACKDLCIPGSAALDLTLPVSAEPPTPAAHAHLFE